MELISKKFEGNIVVTDTLNVTGLIDGDITVENNGVLSLSGLVNGNVILKPGSNVVVRGMVCGNVVNDGGTLEIYGMVTGFLLEHAGDTFVDPVAKILAQSSALI